MQTTVQTIFKCDQGVCAEKNKTFKSSRALEGHYLRVHKRPYKCNVVGCLKAYGTRDKLEDHSRSHTEGPNPFVCLDCARPYATSDALKTHMRCHQEKKSKCPVCGKKLASPRTFENHLASHFGASPYRCYYTDCGKTYTTKFSLERHKRTHKDDKPWQCDMCPKKFSRRSLYKGHMNKHTNNRPHACNICGSRFHSQQALYKHRLCHSRSSVSTKKPPSISTNLPLHFPDAYTSNFASMPANSIPSVGTVHIPQTFRYVASNGPTRGVCDPFATVGDIPVPNATNLPAFLIPHCVSLQDPSIVNSGVSLQGSSMINSGASLQAPSIVNSSASLRGLSVFNPSGRNNKSSSVPDGSNEVGQNSVGVVPLIQCVLCEKGFCDEVTYGQHIREHANNS